MQKPLLFVLFTLLYHGLFAQLYKGTIDKYPIWLNMTSSDDGTVWGAYFYASKGVDIPFEGTLRGKQVTLKAGSVFTEEEDIELFQLTKAGTQLRGNWKLHGKELSVSLKEVDPASVPRPFPANPHLEERSKDPFEAARMAIASLERTDSVTRLKNGIELTWYAEKHWDSELFRVTKGLPEATMKWINLKLEALQVETFSNYGSCGDPAKGFEYFSSVSDYFVNSDFLSLELSHSWYCGGAHPDFGTQQLNLDLKNQRILSTEDLIQFPGLVYSTGDNFTEWSEYRTEFGTRVNDYIKALYPEHMPPLDVSPDEYEDCYYDDPTVWEFSDVRITEDGFKVGAYFARYARSCDDPEWSYIPYDVIREFINPAYRKQLMELAK